MQNKLKQSETKIIKRSEITPADYNPRKITDDARKSLKKNIKANGIIGGMVWNEQTSNLVSGHQKLSIADEVNKYNPETKDNDYDIKVEVINVDLGKEKELNIFFNSKSVQGEYDYAKLAVMIPEIDVDLAGLDEVDLSLATVEIEELGIEIPVFEPQIEKKIEAEIEQGKHNPQNNEGIENPNNTVYHEGGSIDDMERKESAELSAEEKKALVKAVKEKVKQGAVYEGEPYITLSFDNYENKVFFLERFGLAPETKFYKSEEFAELLDERED